jgi:hypothetical protein
VSDGANPATQPEPIVNESDGFTGDVPDHPTTGSSTEFLRSVMPVTD